MRSSSRLAVPIRRPEDVIPHLGKPIHWKQGRSAKALADAWFHAGAIPDPVRAVLDQAAPFRGAELLDGWLERETDLQDSRGTPSQTDLLALLGGDEGLAILGIEAKVDESFGKRIAVWLGDGSKGKVERLARLTSMVGLDPAAAGHLRYQLLHRCAAVVLEAKRFHVRNAALVVQSFCRNASGLADAVAFFEAIGLPELQIGTLIGPVEVAGVQLWVGWAADVVRAEDHR